MEAVKTEADRYAANVLPIIREAQKAGATTLRQIADALNAGVSQRHAVDNGTPSPSPTSWNGLERRSDHGWTIQLPRCARGSIRSACGRCGVRRGSILRHRARRVSRGGSLEAPSEK